MKPADFIRAANALHTHEMDGLKLFRPTEAQEEELHRMTNRDFIEILIKAGNRAGKTVLAAAFFASFVRDEPITTWSGEKIYCRPERMRGHSINAWVIGDHLRHIGATIYRLLFDEHPTDGLSRILIDPETGVWRAWSPEVFPGDRDLKQETIVAPPVIPAHLIKEIAWAPGRAREHEFRCVTLNDGTTIHGFASSGEVKQGDAVHIIWNDENLVTKTHYEEWIARLRDNEGVMVWSTMPRDDCYVFNSVLDRIESEAEEIANGDKDPSEQITLLVALSFLDNPFISDRAKDMALARTGDREALARIFGERSTELISIYQDYNPDFHVVQYSDESLNDRLTEALEENNWDPPADWTRELILDPGTQKPAILLGAVPPPRLWDHGEPYYVVYREIFVRRASPADLARMVMETEQNYRFERFVIDGRMGRQKPPGFTETVDYQYEKAFRGAGLESRQTGHGFIAGDDNFARRSSMVIRSMRTRKCGRPQLRIINQRCPNLVKQLRTNVRKTSPEGEPLEEEAPNQVNDCRVTLEYWISRRPTWRERANDEPEKLDPIDRYYHELHREYDERNPSVSHESYSIPIGAP